MLLLLLEEINGGVPIHEIKAERYEEKVNDLREKVMLKMMEDEGFELDDITLEMVEDRMAKEPDKPPQTSESKKIFAGGLVCADIECILDSKNAFIPILIRNTRGCSKNIFHHWGTNGADLFIETVLQWAKEEKAKDGGVQEFI